MTLLEEHLTLTHFFLNLSMVNSMRLPFEVYFICYALLLQVLEGRH